MHNTMGYRFVLESIGFDKKGRVGEEYESIDDLE